jgi:hypothetical protein
MDDKKLIESHGGPAKLAEKLGYDKAKGGVQRVQNWVDRGIPAKVKLTRPDLFLTELQAEASQHRRSTDRRHRKEAEA